MLGTTQMYILYILCFLSIVLLILFYTVCLLLGVYHGECLRNGRCLCWWGWTGPHSCFVDGGNYNNRIIVGYCSYCYLTPHIYSLCHLSIYLPIPSSTPSVIYLFTYPFPHLLTHSILPPTNTCIHSFFYSSITHP